MIVGDGTKFDSMILCPRSVNTLSISNMIPQMDTLKLFQQNHHHILISWTEHSSAAVKTRETGRTDAEANDICLKAIQCLKYFSFILSIFSFHCFTFMDSKHQTSFDPEEEESFLTNVWRS